MQVKESLPESRFPFSTGLFHVHLCVYLSFIIKTHKIR